MFRFQNVSAIHENIHKIPATRIWYVQCKNSSHHNVEYRDGSDLSLLISIQRNYFFMVIVQFRGRLV